MPLDRRHFIGFGIGAVLGSHLRAEADANKVPRTSLRSPRYDQTIVHESIAQLQIQNAQVILGTLDDDALLKPFRVMGGLPAPGRDLGGWYGYLPDYNWHTGDAGLAPGHCYGQWTSAMARFSAAGRDFTARDRLQSLQGKFADAITPDFFDKTRYPAYTLDKLNCGLLDAHTQLQSPDALDVAETVRRCALPSLPPSALERDTVWRKDRDFSYTWDEGYTLPENLYLLYQAGAGDEYRQLARRFLFESFFDPLARNENVLGGIHGYSHVNALCSAMQAWFVDGSQKHLDAARNGYRMVEAQSYATGGFAPDELFVKPGSGKLLASLTDSHNSFEIPCCTYAFLKLSRYLLQATRDGHYGDAMERLLWNTMFGILPLQPDGRTFYYADNNARAQRVYSAHHWPCCAGTYPQVAADFGINTWQLGPAGEAEVWANLYLPSTLQWNVGSAKLRLMQGGDYPASERVVLHVEASQPVRFRLRLRVPEWCRNASVYVNHKKIPLRVERGFASLDRLWREGDRVDLRLPATLRLEAFPAEDGGAGKELAALCWGPWVLLPLAPAPAARAEELLRAQRVGPAEWLVRRPLGDLYLRPFFAVGSGTYSTYMRLV